MSELARLPIILGNAAPVSVEHHDPDNEHHARRADTGAGTVVQRGTSPAGDPLYHYVTDLPPESSTTDFLAPADWSAAEIAHTLGNVHGGAYGTGEHAWAYHSKAAPSYVAVLGDDKKARTVSSILHDLWGLDELDPDVVQMLVTNAGLDYASKQLGGAASASAVAIYMALTANASAPAAGDTALTGEITTGGGGLIRASTAYAHTGSASTYTLSKTFTANGSDSLPVTVAKMGIFDAASVGNMPFTTLISPVITFNSNGDQGVLTETVTV